MSAFVKAARTVINEVAQAISPLYPPRIWEELGAAFFATFWCLESGDLVVPTAAYQRQQNILQSQLAAIEHNSDLNSEKKRREFERCQTLLNRLSREHDARKVHVDRIRTWLLSERDNWFQTMSATKTDTITQFLQFCVYPRAFFTASDAVYAAQFIHVLHQLKAAQFSTLICLDRIFNDITLPVSMCTEKEAHRYGRFLCSVLDLVMRWHSSEEIFNQECGQYPGFVTVFRKGTDANTKADQLQFENYRHVVHKWHYRVTKAAVACLESGNYAQIRNALIVLTRILPHYPKINQFGSAVERRVNKLKVEEKDKRPDLKVMAFSYAGMMRPMKATWVSEEDFHDVEQKPAAKPQQSQATVNSQCGGVGRSPPVTTETTTTAATITVPAGVGGARGSPTLELVRTLSGSVEPAPKSSSVAPINSKPVRNSTTSSQKRSAVSNAPFDIGNAPGGEHAPSDELRVLCVHFLRINGPCYPAIFRNELDEFCAFIMPVPCFGFKALRLRAHLRLRISDAQHQLLQQQQMNEDSSTNVPSKEGRRLQRKRAAAAASLGGSSISSSVATAGGDGDGRANRESVAYLDLDDMQPCGGSSSIKKSRKGGISRNLSSMDKMREEDGERRHRRSSTSGGHRHHRSSRRPSPVGSLSPTPTPPTASQLRHSRK
ncbi:unnamed protein product [Mesocestoides corti]|uniref:THO complex subunitTHOC2 C-terminal domain-containing protein n=1 Tax=Mesocestoides corti TaxID=53468 RepID=A0A0R3UAV4_MESCO|nr:unnamed protein product [Mesocestoides corti]